MAPLRTETVCSNSLDFTWLYNVLNCTPNCLGRHSSFRFYDPAVLDNYNSSSTAIRRTAISQTLHWRRSVVQYGGQVQSGQAIKLFQAPRKISLPSIFDTNLFSLTTSNLQSYPTTVLNERMWHFIAEVKTYSDRSYIFSGVKTLPTPGSTPWNPACCLYRRVCRISHLAPSPSVQQ